MEPKVRFRAALRDAAFNVWLLAASTAFCELMCFLGPHVKGVEGFTNVQGTFF